MSGRKDFSATQISVSRVFQGGKCPCCERELSKVKCGYHAHHRDGDESNNKSANCLVVCKDCHQKCYHRKVGKPSQPRICRVLNPDYDT